MDKFAIVARAVIDDLSARFPPTELAWAMGIIHPSWWLRHLPPSGEDAWPDAAHVDAKNALQILNTAFCTSKQVSNETSSSSSSSSSVSPLLSYDKLEDEQCLFMHEMLHFLQRSSKAPAPAPAPRPGNNSDSSSDSSSDSGCSSAGEEEPARKEQAAEPATVASRAAEFWAKLESTGGCFRCAEWMKLAELVLVMVPGSVEDERMFSALKFLKSPQRSSLKEKHINVCARGCKSNEFELMSFPYPDAVGRWLDAAKKRGRYLV